MFKSFLGLAKEFQSRTDDTMFAHTTIVSIRYMMSAIKNREQKDNRVAEFIFCLFYDKVADVNFPQAFSCILDLFKQTIRENLFLSNSMTVLGNSGKIDKKALKAELEKML